MSDKGKTRVPQGENTRFLLLNDPESTFLDDGPPVTEDLDEEVYWDALGKAISHADRAAALAFQRASEERTSARNEASQTILSLAMKRHGGQAATALSSDGPCATTTLSSDSPRSATTSEGVHSGGPRFRYQVGGPYLTSWPKKPKGGWTYYVVINGGSSNNIIGIWNNW